MSKAAGHTGRRRLLLAAALLFALPGLSFAQDGRSNLRTPITKNTFSGSAPMEMAADFVEAGYVVARPFMPDQGVDMELSVKIKSGEAGQLTCSTETGLETGDGAPKIQYCNGGDGKTGYLFVGHHNFGKEIDVSAALWRQLQSSPGSGINIDVSYF